MFALIGLGITTIGGLISAWFARKKIESDTKVYAAKALAKIMVKEATAEMDWNTYWAQQANASWKDEWFTIMLSIPVIMVFIPGLSEYAMIGFENLEKTPDWYKAAFGVTVAAAFGFRKLADIIGTRKEKK